MFVLRQFVLAKISSRETTVPVFQKSNAGNLEMPQSSLAPARTGNDAIQHAAISRPIRAYPMRQLVARIVDKSIGQNDAMASGFRPRDPEGV
jgi:hypothetical protein